MLVCSKKQPSYIETKAALSYSANAMLIVLETIVLGKTFFGNMDTPFCLNMVKISVNNYSMHK